MSNILSKWLSFVTGYPIKGDVTAKEVRGAAGETVVEGVKGLGSLIKGIFGLISTPLILIIIILVLVLLIMKPLRKVFA